MKFLLILIKTDKHPEVTICENPETRDRVTVEAMKALELDPDFSMPKLRNEKAIATVAARFEWIDASKLVWRASAAVAPSIAAPKKELECYTLGMDMALKQADETVWTVVAGGNRVIAKTEPGSAILHVTDDATIGSWMFAAQQTLNEVLKSKK